MHIICFINENGDLSYETIYSNSPITSDEIQDWMVNHPKCTVTHVFHERNDETTLITSMEQTFRSHCEAYGLEKTDYNRRFKDGNCTYRIVGLITKNKKYKIQLINETKGTTVKATPAYVRAMLRTMAVPNI